MDIKTAMNELYTKYWDDPIFVGVSIGINDTLMVMVSDTTLDMPETFQGFQVTTLVTGEITFQ